MYVTKQKNTGTEALRDRPEVSEAAMRELRLLMRDWLGDGSSDVISEGGLGFLDELAPRLLEWAREADNEEAHRREKAC